MNNKKVNKKLNNKAHILYFKNLSGIVDLQSISGYFNKIKQNKYANNC